MTNETPGRMPEWRPDGLYMTVLRFLPAYRTRRDRLDVRKLGKQAEISRSPEAIYKWFRKDDLFDANNARALIDVANQPENAALLAAEGVEMPTLTDLFRFV